MGFHSSLVPTNGLWELSVTVTTCSAVICIFLGYLGVSPQAIVPPISGTGLLLVVMSGYSCKAFRSLAYDLSHGIMGEKSKAATPDLKCGVGGAVFVVILANYYVFRRPVWKKIQDSGPYES